MEIRQSVKLDAFVANDGSIPSLSTKYRRIRPMAKLADATLSKSVKFSVRVRVGRLNFNALTNFVPLCPIITAGW